MISNHSLAIARENCKQKLSRSSPEAKGGKACLWADGKKPDVKVAS